MHLSKHAFLFGFHSVASHLVLLAGDINLVHSQYTPDQTNDSLHHHVSATTYEAGWRTDELVGGLHLYRYMLVTEWKRLREEEQMTTTLGFMIKFQNLVLFVRKRQDFCKYA